MPLTKTGKQRPVGLCFHNLVKSTEFTQLKVGNYNCRQWVFISVAGQGLNLAEQCMLLARISCGSAGILKSHPLGRVMREIWQYTIAGYSEDQMKAYLKGTCLLK